MILGQRLQSKSSRASSSKKTKEKERTGQQNGPRKKPSLPTTSYLEDPAWETLHG